MSFSREQQPRFRALVAAAWRVHCVDEGIPVTAKVGREWYEQELFFATRKTSTTECGAGRDYDLAMAHFEELGRAGITWQMRLHTGDGRRLLHELREAVGEDALDAHGVDEDYLRAVARRMLRVDFEPELGALSREQCILVLGEVKRWLRGAARAARADGSAPPLPEEALPF